MGSDPGCLSLPSGPSDGKHLSKESKSQAGVRLALVQREMLLRKHLPVTQPEWM